MLRRTLLAVLFLTPLLALASDPPAARDVDITAPDGFKLRATYYAAAKPGPGVILLHMCNTDRKSWAPLAPQLAAAGINALALDYRGFGESGALPKDADQQKLAEVRQHWPADIETAYAYLLSQPGVDRTRMGAAGGSCGVQNAVQLASKHPEVKSLVLLAGPTNADGIRFLQQNPWLPVFAAAAADDQYDSDAPRAMKWITEISGNPRNQFMGFAEGKHGTEIFVPHPELPKAIVAWYADTLVKSPADANAPVRVKHSAAADFWAALGSPGGAAKAVEIYHRARKKDPQAYLFPESALNLAVYARIQSIETKEAVELAKLNTEAYPNSANTYDTLSDAYANDGQIDKALEAAKKCLALLPADRGNKEFKDLVRQSAEVKIKKLEPAAKKQ
ncbi:MAG TPA: alpha/beta fold hydrolase [Terriglobales bacterium]|nr:alpha/beta fold hydrolase [Terriglobales bacterium]